MQITFRSSPILISGKLPQAGSNIPEFELVKPNFSLLQNKDLQGKKCILYLYPSIDTSVCSIGVQKFYDLAALHKLLIVGISMDLPFALSRYLKPKDLDNVWLTSAFRAKNFGANFGALMTSGQLEGLFSRVVICINAEGTVVHAEQVQEVTDEPDYDAAVNALIS